MPTCATISKLALPYRSVYTSCEDTLNCNIFPTALVVTNVLCTLTALLARDRYSSEERGQVSGWTQCLGVGFNSTRNVSYQENADTVTKTVLVFTFSFTIYCLFLDLLSQSKVKGKVRNNQN